MSTITPPIPKGLAMPFYYGSLQSHWLYFPIDKEVATKVLAQTGCEPFSFSDHGCVAVINFQRYASTFSQYSTQVDEVEFNIIAFPRSMRDRIPSEMTLAQYAYGEEYQKVVGPFRLHVPASDPFAVHAGRMLFGEPKFVAHFETHVPSPNEPPPNSPIFDELRPKRDPKKAQSPTSWKYTVSKYKSGKPEPGKEVEKEKIYSLEIDIAGLDPIFSNSSEFVEYGHLELADYDEKRKDPQNYPELWKELFSWAKDGPPKKPEGALVGGRWNLFGGHALYTLNDKTPYSLSLGEAMDSPMRTDLELIIGTRHPVLMRVFDPPPVAVESRAYYVDPQ